MDGRLEKMTKDYSEDCTLKIQEANTQAEAGSPIKAIEDLLLPFEKDTRIAGDMPSTSKVLVSIVEICFKYAKWQYLNDIMTILAKKRSLIKSAITKMVQKACEYVEQTPSLDIKIKLIECLREITDGKIYVELERARLTLKFAYIREDKNNIFEAATVLQDLQVETYGSMDRKEKVEFILEQMRFCLANKDLIRAQIISKKIQIKYFSDNKNDIDIQELKLKYYRLMVELKSSEENFLEVANFYQNMLETEKILKNDIERIKGTKAVLLYCLLASHAPDQVSLLHSTYNLSTIEDDLPNYKKLARLFIEPEIISWQKLTENYEDTLKSKKTKETGNDTKNDMQDDTESNDSKIGRNSCTSLGEINVFSNDSIWQIFKSRVVEHNLRVISKYYKKITSKRLCELLCLDEAVIENTIAKLVNSGMIYAKIDRLAGIIDFTKHQQSREILNDWSSQLDNLMNLVNSTTYLINKEYMLANAKIGAK